MLAREVSCTRVVRTLRTDAGELGGLLVDHHVDTDAPERYSGRKPAHAGTDDRNRKRPCHRVPHPVFRAA